MLKQNQLQAICLASIFIPVSILASNARTYMSGAPYSNEHFCRLLAKVRLGLKCLTGTNAPAYFGVAYVTKRKKKSFIGMSTTVLNETD
jgi:hypothetical protein